jgi:transcriptional repressor NrdR
VEGVVLGDDLPKVRKRDGSIEEYMPEKIVVSLVKNGISPTAARAIEGDIRKEITGKSTVSTVELAYHALVRLRQEGEAYYMSWIYYDINHKRRRTDYDIKRILKKSLD